MIDLGYTEAQVVIRIAAALDRGILAESNTLTTARQVAAAIYGGTPTRASTLETGDLLDRLGAGIRGRGPAPHSRSMAAVVTGVRANLETARAVKQIPLTLRWRH